MTASLDALEDIVRSHHALIERLGGGASDPVAVRAFVAQVKEAGLVVSAPRERDRLHRILMYWAARDAADREEISEPPVLEQAAPSSREAPSDPGGPQPMSQISPLEFTRMDQVELQKTAKLVRLAATARHWRKAPQGSKEGILLSGPALDEAEAVADEDVDLRAFVDASKAHVERQALARERERMAREEKEKKTFRRVVALLLILSAAVVYSIMSEQRHSANELQKLAAELSSQRDKLQQEKDQFVRLASDAVDQFSVETPANRSLDLLQELLRQHGGASEDELKLLTLVSNAPVRPRADPPRKPVTAPAALDSGAQHVCEGSMWIGNENDRKIDAPTPPLTAIQPGQSFLIRTRTDINLRSDYPSERYEMKPIVGVVPNGARILITGAARPYPRGPTDQIWVRAKVARENCTRVFIQFDGASDAAAPVADALQLAGFQVPPAQSLTRAAGMAEVRYYWPDDESMARTVAAAISRALNGRRISVRSLDLFEIKPASGVLEAWLDLKP